jgi:hypothetical protein
VGKVGIGKDGNEEKKMNTAVNDKRQTKSKRKVRKGAGGGKSKGNKDEKDEALV